MRHTSYRNLTWIAALFATSCITAPAQLATSRATSPPIQQLSTVERSQAPAPSLADSNQQQSTPKPQAQKVCGQSPEQVEKASMVPDSTSLLPVAAVVGFSFLLGGIVCGTIKKRP